MLQRFIHVCLDFVITNYLGIFLGKICSFILNMYKYYVSVDRKVCVKCTRKFNPSIKDKKNHYFKCYSCFEYYFLSSISLYHILPKHYKMTVQYLLTFIAYLAIVSRFLYYYCYVYFPLMSQFIFNVIH